MPSQAEKGQTFLDLHVRPGLLLPNPCDCRALINWKLAGFWAPCACASVDAINYKFAG